MNTIEIDPLSAYIATKCGEAYNKHCPSGHSRLTSTASSSVKESIMPNISVIMSTYKENAALVEASIDSVLHQTYCDFEFLIIIDCPDNQPVKDLAYRKQIEDNRITVIENEYNLGLVKSLNKALGIAKGNYICRMDADDISEPNRIESQLSFLTSNELDLVGGRMSIIDESGAYLYDIPQPPITPNAVNRALRWNNCVPHPTWLGKVSAFAQGYREIPLCEDYDFLLRASMAGLKIGNCNQEILKYRMTSESISRSSLFRQYLYQRYITKEFRKNRAADPREANIYVDAAYSEAKAIRYSKANDIFNNALASLGKRRYFKASAYSAELLFCSINYLNKMLRLALASLAS